MGADRERRRRLGMVGVALIALLWTGWLLRSPSIDPRFVGTWTIQDLPEERITYSPDGTFGRRTVDGMWVQGQFGWSVSGDRLHHKVVYDDPLLELRDTVFDWLHVLRHGTSASTYTTTIKEVTKDRIVLQNADGTLIVYVRIVDREQDVDKVGMTATEKPPDNRPE